MRLSASSSSSRDDANDSRRYPGLPNAVPGTQATSASLSSISVRAVSSPGPQARSPRDTSETHRTCLLRGGTRIPECRSECSDDVVVPFLVGCTHRRNAAPGRLQGGQRGRLRNAAGIRRALALDRLHRLDDLHRPRRIADTPAGHRIALRDAIVVTVRSNSAGQAAQSSRTARRPSGCARTCRRRRSRCSDAARARRPAPAVPHAYSWLPVGLLGLLRTSNRVLSVIACSELLPA